jgi:flagellar basal body P-ring formation protein FlgA
MTVLRPYVTIAAVCVFLAGVPTAAASLASERPDAVVTVFHQTEVNTGEIRLGDISRVTGDDPILVQKLRRIAIGTTPLPGKSRSLDEARIKIRLKQSGVDASQIALNVPQNAEVVRGVAYLSEETLREAVLAYIRGSAPLESGKVNVKEIRVDKVVQLPKGVVNLSVEQPRNRDLSGKVPLGVNIYVNGELERKVWAVADIEVLREVIVAKRPLGRYHEITEDDVEIREMDAARLPSGTLVDVGDLLGKRTRRNIHVNTVLRADMVEFPPLVKRGDVVAVIAESKGLRITVLGIVKEREGREGERILVENLDSKKRIYSQVVDAKTVRVDF